MDVVVAVVLPLLLSFYLWMLLLVVDVNEIIHFLLFGFSIFASYVEILCVFFCIMT